MTSVTAITVCIVAAAVAFDFVNGFHDASNSIATLVATRTMKPRMAVLWAGIFNFAALFFFGTGVAKTVGSGMVKLEAVTPVVILSGLLGAVIWGLLTWWKRIPTSSSHALLGGYAGAAMFNSALTYGFVGADEIIIASGWIKTLIFIVIAPVLGLVLSFGLMSLTLFFERRYALTSKSRIFTYLQMASSAFLSLMHGSNDAQKTAGIIAGALVAGGYFKEFTIPQWVLWISYGTMGLGTLAGGWRVVRTLGQRLTHLEPAGGFCAESSAAASIFLATFLNLPVSTTHVTTGAVLGVGSAQNPDKVRWKLARRIALAWALTIPAAAFFGAVINGLALVCGGR
jgi:PiT family inorganic phosphate transporter